MVFIDRIWNRVDDIFDYRSRRLGKRLQNNKNNREYKNCNQLHGGFTLVELVVVLLILAILLALTTLAIIEWQDWAYFNQQNEYAQTLFLDAQNQLAEYRSNGTLGNFASQLMDDYDNYERELTATKLAELTNDAGVAYDWNTVWYEGLNKSDADKYQDVLVYATCKKGDYEEYKAGALSAEAKATGADVVFELLESYVYDTSILNAAISVEFTPGEGQVFSVCYSNRNDAFVYETSTVSGIVDIRNRAENRRRQEMFGYYGVDTLAKSTSAHNSKPQLISVMLLNEETLNLSFKVNRYPQATQKFTYTMEVHDKDTKKPVLRVTLDGKQLHNYENRTKITCPVVRYSYDASGTATENALGNYGILAWVDQNQKVHIALDAVDLEASSYDYVTALRAGLQNKAKSEMTTTFTDTLSFHRFGLDADNVYCTIKGSGGGYASTSVKKSNTESAYFGTSELKTSGTKETYEITLENERHLYNVRYAEDLTWSDYNTYSTKVNRNDFAMKYALTADLDWKEFSEDGNVYSSKNTVSTVIGNASKVSDTSNVTVVEAAVFPSIENFRYGDSLTGQKGLINPVAPKIKGLTIKSEANALLDVYDFKPDATSPAQKKGPTGLFAYNYGSLEKLVMDEVLVAGEDKVGAFCGSNAGDLQNLEVANTGFASSVEGKTNVGGIMGYLQTLNDSALSGTQKSTPLDMERLVNRATVKGTTYVGGIVGRITVPNAANQPTVTLLDCKNYGVMEAVPTDNDPKSARYIGGITGFCDNRFIENGTIDEKHVKLENCISSPEYSDAVLGTLLDTSVDDAVNALKNQLNGVYVGGIVGYNSYSTIENCSTIAEKKKTGYVFGYQYVGGIVGFNQGPAGAIKGGIAAANGVNEAHVVGYQYVGGIVGCNSGIKGTHTGEATGAIVEPDRTMNPEVKISNWVNKGIVFAVERYAGGITGYNAGWIFACDSQVGSTGNADFFQTTYSGDYAGGIAGYNNGIIGNTVRSKNAVTGRYEINDSRNQAQKTINAVCYISGNNYVGGIVGYNDVDSIVEDYGIAGGFIRGNMDNSCFVGGYAGFNASVYMLLADDKVTPRNIVSNPNQVTGRYFVGGSIGGNIINTNGENSSLVGINTIFKTDNFLGTMNAKEFSGGFVGYNAFIDCAPGVVAGDVDADMGVVYVLQRDIIKAFRESDQNEGIITNEALLSQKIDILEDVIVKNGETSQNIIPWNIAPSAIQFAINGTNESETQNTLGMITAEIYAGGVLGYNDDDTTLYVVNVKNTTPVMATVAIERAAEQPGRTVDYAGRPFTYKYSYAGGIIGRVGKNTTIDHCYNTISGSVTSQGTYTGGICEINAGAVRNCIASVFGSSVKEYVGAITGLNETGAIIETCDVSGNTYTGKNVVSAVAAENFGTIRGTQADDVRIVVSGKSLGDTQNAAIDGVAGVLAAYNAGTIEMQEDIKNINIRSNGNHVGIVCGINEGLINNVPSNEIILSGNVLGRMNVGGVIGTNNSGNTGTIALYVNQAGITATYGNAGGIIGNNVSKNHIQQCKNYGEVIATQSGNAGGITARNASKISDCTDYAVVSARNGMGAGIVAINETTGVVENCNVRPEGDSVDELLTFASLNVSGGACGENYGILRNLALDRVQVTNLATSKYGDIGVVAGRNMATGTIELAAGEVLANCTARTYKNDSYVGGISGVNYGVIQGANLVNDLPTTIVNADVTFVANAAEIANFGGISGKNLGKIEKISVKGNVVGNLGSATAGCGGITGFSGLESNGIDREDCYGNLIAVDNVIQNCTFDGVVHAYGAGAAYARIGGVAGINGYGSVVRECVLGVLNDVDADGNPLETAILAGHVEKADTGIKTQYGQTTHSGVGDNASFSYIGGLCGETYGDILSCDNHRYSVDDVRVESFAGIQGGIVGVAYGSSTISGTSDEHLTTGSKWVINLRTAGVEMGDGGIVGNCYSTHDVSYVDNYGSVLCLYSGATTSSTGGIFGRWDQNDNPDMHMSYCNNYGMVVSYNRAAGFVGVLKSKGVTFEHCINYSYIHSISTNKGAGGFVSDVSNLTTNLVFLDCKNHGEIVASKDAFGFTLSPSSLYDGAIVILDNCVNTGVLAKVASNGTFAYNGDGMGAFIHDNGTKITYYNNCRNYTNSLPKNYSYGKSANVIYNCLDHSGRATTPTESLPFNTPSKGGDNNYFIIKSGAGKNTKEMFNTLVMKQESDGYWLYPSYYGAAYQQGTHITMVRNNPIADSYYTDRSPYEVAYDYADDDSRKMTPVVNSRIGVYKELDPLFENFVIEVMSSKTALTGSLKPKIVLVNGMYKLAWSKITDAYQYESYYTLVDAKGEVKYSSKDHVDVTPMSLDYKFYNTSDIYSHWKDEWGAGKIVFYVKAINAYHLSNPDAADAGDYDLPEEHTTASEVAITLPMPKTHMEFFDSKKGNKNVVIVLDNKEEFYNYQDECEIIFTINTNNSINSNAKQISVDPVKGYSDPFELTAVSEATDVMRKSYANPKKGYEAKYIPSASTLVFGRLMNSAQAKTSTTNMRTTFNGLYYGSISNLAFNTTIHPVNNNRDFTVNADLIVHDDELGVDVAQAFGRVKVSGTDKVITLTDFAESIQDKNFEVRTYYHQGQNVDAVYGRDVLLDISAELLKSNEDVKQLMDTKYFDADGNRIQQSICDETTGQLKPGYVLINNHDDTYSVYYSAFLAMSINEGKKNYQVWYTDYELSDTTNADGYRYYTITKTTDPDTTSTQQIQVKPIISSNYAVQRVNGVDEYIFSWDVKDANGTNINIAPGSSMKLYKNAQYYVELIGTTMEGDEVILGSYDNLAAQQCKFVDTLNNWNYTDLTLKVARIGTVNSNSATVIIPSMATYTYSRKLKLTQIATPSINLQMSGGVFDSNGLVYDVDWDPITSAQEKQELAGYLVKIEVSEASDPSIVEKPHYYYIKVAGDEKQPALAVQVDQDVVYHEALAEEYKINDEGCTLVVDLADFNGLDKLAITVQAIAIKDSIHFADSEISSPLDFVLPKRLLTPDMSNMKLNTTHTSYTYDLNQAVLMSLLNDNGIPLKMTLGEDVTGIYELMMELHETQDSETKESFFTKAQPAKMSGVGGKLTEATYEFNVTGDKKLSDYAGQWIKIAARATSDNQIASMWSDADAVGLTQDYYWYQIPRVQVEQPGITVGNAARYYNPETGNWLLDKGGLSIVAQNPLLTFNTVDYADAYKIQLSGDQQLAWIYLEKQSDDQYQVLYSQTDAADWENPAGEVNGVIYTQNLGVAEVGSHIELPYIGKFTTDKLETTVTSETNMEMNTWLDLSQDGTGNVLIQLQLPNVTHIGMDEESVVPDSHVVAKDVIIQAVVNEDKKECYESSAWDHWNATADNTVVIPSNSTLELAPTLSLTFDADETIAKDEVASAADPATTNPWYYFKWENGAAGETYVVKLMQLDADDNVQKVRYCYISDSNVLEYVTLDKSLFAAESTNKVKMSVAKITEEGLISSEWSDQQEVVATPATP